MSPRDLPHPFGALAAAVLALLLSIVPAPLRAQLPVSGPEIRANGIVFAVEQDSQGRVYFGGSFEDYNGDDRSRGLVRVSSAAVLDKSWDIRELAPVSDLQLLGDFLYVAGGFSSVATYTDGTVARSGLARIHVGGPLDGRLDLTWNPSVNGPVELLEDAGSTLYIAGSFSSVNGVSRTRMAAILTAGPGEPISLGSFNPQPDGRVEVMKLISGRIYFGGEFGMVGGTTQPYLARSSGSGLDGSWTPDINGPVSSLAGGGGYLYVGGSFNRVEEVPIRALARYSLSEAMATADTTWEPDPDGEVNQLLLSGNNLYAAGVFLEIGELPQRFLARIDVAGTTADTSFRPGLNGAINDMRFGAGGILAVGQFFTTSGVSSRAFASFSTGSGTPSSSFRGTITTSGQIFTMTPDGSGGVYIGGIFDTVGGAGRTSIAQLNSSGTVTSFNPRLVGANRSVNDIAVNGGDVFIGGDFFEVSGVSTFHLAKLSSSGAPSSSFRVKPFAPITAVAVSGSRVYAGSEGMRFVTVGPPESETTVDVASLARFDTGDGMVDINWRPLVTFNGNPAGASVRSIEVGGGGIIITGRFSFIVNPNDTGQAFQRVGAAALSTGGWGEPLAGWSTQFLSATSDVATIDETLLHNGSLYVAGNIAFVNGNQWFGIAKLDPNGGAWDAGFDVSPVRQSGESLVPASVAAIAASGSHLYIGGSFDRVFQDGVFVFNPDIARVDAASGELDYSWYPYVSSSVTSLANSSGTLWMGGAFSFVGPFESNGIAAVRPNTASYQAWLDQYFSPAEQLNSDNVSPLVDSDDDGLVNFYEAVFNLNPRIDDAGSTASGSTAGVPVLGPAVIDEQRYMTVEFVRYKASANAGIEVVPEFSSDLRTFEARGVEVSVESVDAERERVVMRDSIGGLPSAFARYRVVATPP